MPLVLIRLLNQLLSVPLDFIMQVVQALLAYPLPELALYLLFLVSPFLFCTLEIGILLLKQPVSHEGVNFIEKEESSGYC